MNSIGKDLDYKKRIHDVLLKTSRIELISFVYADIISNDIGFPPVEILGCGRLGYPLSKEQAASVIKSAKPLNCKG